MNNDLALFARGMTGDGPGDDEEQPPYLPQGPTKDDLLALLRDSGLPRVLPVEHVLEQFADFAVARQGLDELVSDGPAMFEYRPNETETLPPALRRFAWWYMRLPAQWAAQVGALAAQPRFTVHVGSTPDPWYVAQYIGIG